MAGRTLVVGVVALVIVGLGGLWGLPLLLTREPSAGVSSVERLDAVNDVRATLVTLAIAAGAAVSLVYTARSYRISSEGHLTDRFSRAVEHLGSDQVAVRVGGLYELERIAKDSPPDRTTVIYTIGAFIRQPPPPSAGTSSHPPRMPADLQTALSVAARLARGWDDRLDLRGASLRHAQLPAASLARALLDDADLRGADLRNADLRGASLVRTDLTGSDLEGSDRRDADLRDAITTDTILDDG